MSARDLADLAAQWRYEAELSGDVLRVGAVSEALRRVATELEAYAAGRAAPDGPRDLPPAAVVEIIERGARTDDTVSGSVVIPDEIRVNGHRLLVAEGGIRVHEMTLGGSNEPLLVTVTLFARRVTIAAEHDL